MARIRFYGGKGGVGKTTVAAAQAEVLSSSGPTLLVSTDPAHNLSDLFDISAGSEITTLHANLDLLEIDPEQEARRYLDEVKANIREHVRPALLDEVHRHIDMAYYSPGANESALFDRLTRLILDESAEYEHIIFDTAPTGHTLRLITLPEMMGMWVDGLIGRRSSLQKDSPQWVRDVPEQSDPVLEKLKERKARFSQVREILVDANKTGFWFVANPEKLSLLETQRAVKDLLDHRIPVKGIIINKVLSGLPEGDFFSKRAEAQKPYISKLKRIKGVKTKLELPLLERDIADQATFRQICRLLHDAV